MAQITLEGFYTFTPNVDIELEPIKAKVSMAYLGDDGTLKIFDAKQLLNFDITKLLANTPYLIYVKEAIELDGSVGAIEGGGFVPVRDFRFVLNTSTFDSVNYDFYLFDSSISNFDEIIQSLDLVNKRVVTLPDSSIPSSSDVLGAFSEDWDVRIVENSVYENYTLYVRSAIDSTRNDIYGFNYKTGLLISYLKYNGSEYTLYIYRKADGKVEFRLEDW